HLSAGGRSQPDFIRCQCACPAHTIRGACSRLSWHRQQRSPMHVRRMDMTSRLPAGPALHNGASTSLAHCLHSLLSCIRCIAQREDTLCELLHEVQHYGASAGVRGEVFTLIDELPAADYVDDLDALRAMLGTSRLATNPGRARRRTPRASATKQ